MQDRKTLDKNTKRARDSVMKETTNNTPEDNAPCPKHPGENETDPNVALIDAHSKQTE